MLSSRLGALSYGVTCYALFLVSFLYCVGFIGDLWVPTSVSRGPAGPLGSSLAINAALLGLFAVQHTIMARSTFKERWTRIIPPAVERSTFVLATCGVLALMFWQWRPLPDVVWQVEADWARALVYGIFALGWVIVLVSTFLIDHFELFGLRQVVDYYRGVSRPQRGLQFTGLYRVMRHPLLFGFSVAFWAAPDMTVGRLCFCVLTTAYILIGVRIEERDLVRAFGDDYRSYQRRVPMLVPGLRRRAPADGVSGLETPAPTNG